MDDLKYAHEIMDAIEDDERLKHLSSEDLDAVWESIIRLKATKVRYCPTIGRGVECEGSCVDCRAFKIGKKLNEFGVNVLSL